MNKIIENVLNDVNARPIANIKNIALDENTFEPWLTE